MLIFLSHAHQDLDRLKDSVFVPLSHHVEVWYSARDIKAAEEWNSSILGALQRCDWFAVFLTKISVESEWVRSELLWAFQHRPSKIVPVLVEQCKYDKLSLRLNTVQHLDLTGADPDSVAKLLQALAVKPDMRDPRGGPGRVEEPLLKTLDSSPPHAPYAPRAPSRSPESVPLPTGAVARLVFVTGSKSGSSAPLLESENTIGRKQNQDVRFSRDEILVSAEHAYIVFRDGRYVLRDLSSRNGTFVNRKRITETIIHSGDIIEFGIGGPSAQFVIDTSPPGLEPGLF